MDMKQKQKILIVDDRKENLLALRKVLADLDVEIIEAASGNEALAATLDHDFAVAILDVMMPGMDGYELAAYLRGDAKTRNTPIIFLTAVYSEEERIFKGYEIGAVDYIVKPYNPVILISKVRVFLELEKARMQLAEKINALTVSEQALRESEAIYRAIAENFPDGAVYIFDSDLRFRVADGKAMETLGYSRENLEGKTIYEATDVETCRILEQRYPRVLAGESLHFETSLKGRVFSSSYVPIRDDNKKVIAGMVVSHDITEHKAAEQALKRSEERWNAALENIGEGVIIATEDEQVIYWNPAAMKMHGFVSENEGIGPLEDTPDTFELRTPDGNHLLELDEWPMRRIKRGETVRNLELGLRRPDQAWEKIVSYSGAMVQTMGGERLIFLSVHDLTEQRKAEETLRLTQASIDAAAEMVAWFTPDGSVRYANDATCRALGYSREELLRMTAMDFSPGFTREQYQQHWNEVRKRKSFTLEVTHRRKNGSEYPAEVLVNHVVYGGQEYIFAYGRDITEHRKAEEKLRESEERFRVAQELSPDGFTILQPVREGGKIVDFIWVYENTAIARLNGTDPEKVIGHRLSELLPNHVGTPFHEVYKQVAETGEPRVLEAPYQGGTVENLIWFRVAVVPLGNDIAILAQDITAHKQAEEKIRVALTQKEVLLKEIHHRVKNNMQVISSLVSLQAGRSHDTIIGDVLKDVSHRVRSMAMVHEKLYQSTDLAHVDFARYAESLINFLWRSFGMESSSILFIKNLETVLLPVDKAVPLGLMLNEIISNVFKHAFPDRRKGKVSISLNCENERRVVLCVRDNGKGLPKGLDWKAADSLGLHLVQMLASQIHADVEVTSNEGTEFKVTLGVEK